MRHDQADDQGERLASVALKDQAEATGLIVKEVFCQLVP
jgi:hypothetical protein